MEIIGIGALIALIAYLKGRGTTKTPIPISPAHPAVGFKIGSGMVSLTPSKLYSNLPSPDTTGFTPESDYLERVRMQSKTGFKFNSGIKALVQDHPMGPTPIAPGMSHVLFNSPAQNFQKFSSVNHFPVAPLAPVRGGLRLLSGTRTPVMTDLE